MLTITLSGASPKAGYQSLTSEMLRPDITKLDRLLVEPYRDINNPVAHSLLDPKGGVQYAAQVVYFAGKYFLYFGGNGTTLNTSSYDQIFGLESSDMVNWTLINNGAPVLSQGAGYWEQSHINDPSVVEIGGVLHMYYSSCARVLPADDPDYIGHATSTDGRTWTKDPANPVLSKTAGAWDSERTSRPAVVYKDGVVHLWYDGGNLAYSSSQWQSGQYYYTEKIGYARATDPSGPFTKNASYVWDNEYYAADAEVLWSAEANLFWIAAHKTAQTIPFFSSADGKVWSYKKEVLTKQESYENGSIGTPDFFLAPDGELYFFYSGVTTAGIQTSRSCLSVFQKKIAILQNGVVVETPKYNFLGKRLFTTTGNIQIRVYSEDESTWVDSAPILVTAGANVVFTNDVSSTTTTTTTTTGAPGSTTSTTTAGPPATPAGLSVSNNPAQITAHWSAVPGTTQYALIYRYFNQPDGTEALGFRQYDGKVLIDGSLTSYTITTGLPLGNPLYWKIAAINGSVYSAYSASVSATPAEEYVPPPVISATSGNGQVTVSLVSLGKYTGTNWTLGYGPNLEYSWGGSGGFNLAVGTLGTIVGLTNDVPCKLRLQVFNSGYTASEVSNIVTVTPAIPSIVADPLASGGVTTTADLEHVIPPPGVDWIDVLPGNRQIILRWPAVQGAVQYSLYSTSDGSDPTVFSSKTVIPVQDADRVTVQSLVNGGTYKFAVTAVSAAGLQSLLSPIVTGVPRIIDPLRFWVDGKVLSFAETSGGPLRFNFGGRVFEFGIADLGPVMFQTPLGVIAISSPSDLTIPHDLFSTSTLDAGGMISMIEAASLTSTGTLGAAGMGVVAPVAASDLASTGALSAAALTLLGGLAADDLTGSGTLDVAALVGGMAASDLTGSTGTLDAAALVGALPADTPLTGSGTLDTGDIWLPTATIVFSNYS